MNGAFYIAATGLQAQQRGLDAIANNIANVNTLGFKRSSIGFAELMAAPRTNTDDLLGGVPQNGGMSGVRADVGLRDFGQGDIRSTGAMLDISIDGKGFFEVLGPGGQVYLWRGGQLKVDADGYLAASNGMQLRAMISPPVEDSILVIDPDGVVKSGANERAELVEIGHIDLVRVADESSLSGVGGGLYMPESDLDILAFEPGEDGTGRIVQGALETSNVKLTDEMVSLMLMQRAFTASAQVVQAGDELMSIMNNLRR